MGENKYKKEAASIKPVNLDNNVPIDYNFERLLKSFMKDVEKRGIIKEVRDRRYYKKPSDKRREELNKRRKR